MLLYSYEDKFMMNNISVGIFQLPSIDFNKLWVLIPKFSILLGADS